MIEEKIENNQKSINPNCLRNLKQFKGMSETSFLEYVNGRNTKTPGVKLGTILGISIAVVVIGLIIWKIYKDSRQNEWL